jgi:hypothetical protein
LEPEPPTKQSGSDAHILLLLLLHVNDA